MRIVGGRDYYDTALALGHDASTVFVRETGRCLSDRDLIPITSVHVVFSDAKRYRSYAAFSGRIETVRYHDSEFALARIAVIFCGKLYRGMWLSEGASAEATCFWDMESLVAHFAKRGLKITLGRKIEEPLDVALFATKAVDAKLLDVLILNRVVHAIRFPQTLYVPGGPSWLINSDQLRIVQFYRKLDPYQTFQEIDMWVSSVLFGTTADMAEIADADRIAKHGFDRWSFRRPKQT